jgi:hypothetical protein
MGSGFAAELVIGPAEGRTHWPALWNDGGAQNYADLRMGSDSAPELVRLSVR